LQVISGPGGRRAQFSHPSAVAVDSAGDVYVADTGHNRVFKFLPKQVGGWQ
jgi:DNA-binding beta-propeller fold protein YncE